MVFPALGGLHVPELPARGGGCPVVLEDPLVLGDTPHTFPVIARAAREGLVPHPDLQGLAKVDRSPVVVAQDISSRRSYRCKRDCRGQDYRARDLGYPIPHPVLPNIDRRWQDLRYSHVVPQCLKLTGPSRTEEL